MDYNILVQQLLDNTLPLLQEEAEKLQFTQQVELIKKEFARSQLHSIKNPRAEQINTSASETNIKELNIQAKNLKHQKDLTKDQAKIKEHFFAEVSHELRTPLHGILGMSYLLENSQLSLEQRGFIDIIQVSADNLLLIINALLNLSKTNIGKTTLILESFSTEKFLNDLKTVTAFNAKGKGLITNKKTIASLNFPTTWQDKKILMLEDNEANLVYAQNLFASGNITLEIAKDIEGAKIKLAKNQYDCFLSDVKLPDGNGLDLIAKLRGDNSAINQKIPIIILTASANEKEANYAEQLDVQSYIGKPFPPQLLIKEMKKIMNPEQTKKQKTSVNLSEYNTTTAPYFANLEKSFKGKPRLQIEMFDIFLDQLPLAIEQMGKGLKENDMKIFHYDAHRIKSTINIIDLPKLKPLIYKMDEYCYRKINLDKLPDLFEAFKKQAAIDVRLIHAKKEALMVAN